MPSQTATVARPPGPWTRAGFAVLGVLVYLGQLGMLAGALPRALVRPNGSPPSLRHALVAHGSWMLGMGLPLVALVHIGMGSFLAMQAFYGATFVEAVGPVVGVGLFRNVAPLLSGLTLAGLLACRIVPELARGDQSGLDDDPTWIPDRDVARGRQADPRTPPEPERLAAVRVLAAAGVGPVLATTGALVGTLIGWSVAQTLLGIPSTLFFGEMQPMLWGRDIVGLVVKGAAFAGVAALLACHEGRRARHDPDRLAGAAFRAVCLSALAILIINSAWFVWVYWAGPAFGPSVFVPPTR